MIIIILERPEDYTLLISYSKINLKALRICYPVLKAPALPDSKILGFIQTIRLILLQIKRKIKKKNSITIYIVEIGFKLSCS